MKSFCGTITKEDMLAEIVKHRKADQILQGTYGEGTGDNWKGCAVGCSIKSINDLKGKKYETNNHKVYETELGIPEWLARLEDKLFEGLPVEKAKLWPEQFIKAVPVGIDLEPVKWKFTSYLMKENIDRVLGLDIPDELKEQVVGAIRGVLAVAEDAARTGVWDESAAWSAAWSAARSAAESAARSAWSAAESAAESAAWYAAWYAARSAAESAAWYAAWYAAESAAWYAESAALAGAVVAAAYTKHSKKLLALLRQEGRMWYE